MLAFIGFLLICLLLSFIMTGWLKRYAQHHLIDQPNARSSHKVPTPRGGGMAIVIIFLLAIPLLASQVTLGISTTKLGIIWVAALSIAVIGFIDDHVSLTPVTRLIVQGISAILVVWAVNGLPVLMFSGWYIDLAWFGYVLAWIGVIWFINLYNFMDGIDGLAASEAAIVCLFMALMHYLYFGEWTASGIVLLLGVAVMGFLFWNFPPAKIFMGDGGSGFLGLMMATLMLLDASREPQFLWAWLTILGVFVVDATWTLLSRFKRGCRLSDAHRTHAYQNASRRWRSHRRVTLSIIALTMFWLAPIASLIVFGYLDGVVGLVIAYIPLCYFTYHLGAGVPE